MKNEFSLFAECEAGGFPYVIMERVNKEGTAFEYQVTTVDGNVLSGEEPLPYVPENHHAFTMAQNAGLISGEKEYSPGFSASINIDSENPLDDGFFDESIAKRYLFDSFLRDGPSPRQEYCIFSIDENGLQEDDRDSHPDSYSYSYGISEFCEELNERFSSSIRNKISIIFDSEFVPPNDVEFINSGSDKLGIDGLSVISCLVMGKKIDEAVNLIQSGLVDFEKIANFHFNDYEVAASNGAMDVVIALSEAGVPLRIQNGKSAAISNAEENWHREVADVLRSIHAKNVACDVLKEIKAPAP